MPVLLVVTLAVLNTSLSVAETHFVLLGKHKVHPTRILARYADGVDLQSSAVSLQSLGLSVRQRYQLVPGLVLLDSGPGVVRAASLPGTQADPASALIERIRALERTGWFEYVQPSYVYTNLVAPQDVRYSDGTLWGLRNTGAFGGRLGADIEAARAWDVTTGSTNVIVAVIDSGVRYTHQELAGQMWRNPGEIPENGIDDDRDGYVDNVFGMNALDHSGDPFDANDHGTHIAGTIGAAANDGHPHVGVAWNVRLMACKFLDAGGFGHTADAILAIDFAVQNGARIINASWAGAPYERAFLDALTEARRKGVLFVAAAGNDFNDNDASPVYPASYRLDNVIAVAATDRQDRLVSYSNFGRTSVHLGAPGEDIFSCGSRSDTAYETLSGTSMAAPFVSGVATLLLARFPDASVSELRERLLATAVKIPNLSQRTATGGRLNAYRALTVMPDGVLEISFDPPEGSELSARRPVPFFVTVTDLSAVKNAIVRARIQGAGDEILFRNDGIAPDLQAQDNVYSAEVALPTAPGNFDMLFTVTAPGKTNFTRTVNYVVTAPPLNDQFADALDIPPQGTFLIWTNRFATIEPGEPRHAVASAVAASVWWNWQPAASGPAFVDTTGSSFDTVLAVYTNNTLPTLKEVISADDAGRQKQAYVSFQASAGVTYHIAVAGFSASQVGAIRLRVEPGGGPDITAPQVEITGPDSGLVITNANDAKVTVTGTAIDPSPNASGVRQVQVQVNREIASTASGTTNWSSTVLLQEGPNRIKIIAADYAGNLSSARSIAVAYEPVISPNDLLANAVELTGTNGVTSGNNTRAGRERGEPQHAGNSGGKSIWWLFRPPSDGLLTLSTANSTFNTLLALYTGASTRMADLVLVADNDDAFAGAGFSKLSQAVKAGEACYIAVDGFDGSSGIVQLEFSFVPGDVYRLTIQPSQGGSVEPGSGYYAKNQTVLVTATPDPFYSFEGWEGGINSTENPLAVRVTGDLVLSPRFQSFQFTEGFESGGLNKLPWSSSGNAAWSVQSDVVLAGRFAARSGRIGSGQKTSLILTNTFREGTGTFSLRVSSEQIWDVLDFFVNGRRLARWSGEVAWTSYQFPVARGANVLEWRYSKDLFETSAGLDAAFIDNIDLPLQIPVDASTPARLDLKLFTDGRLQLTVYGQVNQQYLIQSSPDLHTWQTLSTHTATDGAIRWTSRPGANDTHLFYRAIVQ